MRNLLKEAFSWRAVHEAAPIALVGIAVICACSATWGWAFLSVAMAIWVEMTL